VSCFTHFADYGIGNDFLQKVRSKVTEGTSALFLLVGQVTTDRVVEAFKAAPKFEVLASNLSKESALLRFQPEAPVPAVLDQRPICVRSGPA